MTACAIRYRLDGSGPATFLVECDGELRVYARGVLGGVMPAGRVLATLADRGCRWVPASGSVLLAPGDQPTGDAGHEAAPFPTGATGFDEATAAG